MYELVEPIWAGEFVWMQSTDVSGGWIADQTINLPWELGDGEIPTYQVQDRLRYKMGVKYDFDDKRFDETMIAKALALNIRRGKSRIVKVVAENKIPSNSVYPNAPRNKRVPQWEVRVFKSVRLLYTH